MAMKDEFENIIGFQWDDGNVDKNRVLHNFEDWESEQVFFNAPLLIGSDPKHSNTGKRWAAFGHTDEGSLLTVVFTKRGSLIRVISARDMSRKERKFYEENA
jgi:uncharacterized DUF497 family protein